MLWSGAQFWTCTLQMPENCQEELSKATSLQSHKFRGEAQAWMGLEWGPGELHADCVPVCAFLGPKPSPDSQRDL